MINPDFTRTLEKWICIGLKEAKKEENFVDDGKFHFLRKFNGSILIYGRRRSSFPFHCLVGPDWPMVMLVYSLIISINIIVLYFVSDLGYPVIIIGGLGACLVLLSYSFTSCSDPGYIFECDYAPPPPPPTTCTTCNNQKGDVEMGECSSVQARTSQEVNPITPSSPKVSSGLTAVPPPSTIECGHCQLQRPYSSHHCTFCSNCVEKLDHHCPWCGKCIGKKNMNAFQTFLMSLCFQFYFLIGAAVYYGISVYANAPTGPGFH
jgi:hypothetical protein